MEEESLKMQQILKMKGGIGEESYANNSKSQTAYLSKSMPTLEQAVHDLCYSNLPETVTIADLGCSSGPNTLFAITQIMATISRTCYQMGKSPLQFQVFLNDLPGNDFNTVFKSLAGFLEKMRQEIGDKFGPCYIGGVPGSFYDRLFPSKSLHFAHSSSSLHWLSQVPSELTDKEKPVINKGKIYISKTSSIEVINAYMNQFQRDFSSFLKSRSEEIAPGGRMVLTFRGRRMADPAPDESCLLWDYLGLAFQHLVQKGLIDEEKLDTYNTPYYEPYIEEIKAEIIKQGSFTLDRLQISPIPWDGVNGGNNYSRPMTSRQMAKAIRAVNESMIRNHFGPDIINPLFDKFIEIMETDTKEVEHVSLVVSVIRNA